MPRVSTKMQFARYKLLRDVYVARRSVYGYLSIREQSAIYTFYQPHRDHLPQSLAVHQRAAAKGNPSLPHRAGKAWEALADAAIAIAKAEAERPIGPVVGGHRTGPKPKRNIVARPLVRPEPDIDKLTRVLIDLAKQMAAAERQKQEATHAPSEPGDQDVAV